MQMLALEIQESFLPEFLKIIEPYGDRIRLQTDKNIEYDPYFYDRQRELHKIRDDIQSGKIEMKSHAEVWDNINSHLNNIQ